jgi:GMP reductase
MEIFDYDNVLLLPRKCRVESRSQCDPSMEFGGRNPKLPVVPANMKTVVDEPITEWLAANGYFYVMHRFDLDNVAYARRMRDKGLFVSISSGVKTPDYAVIDQLAAEGIGADYITIDIAHGHAETLRRMIDHIKRKLPNAFVIAGNVGTPEAVIDLENWAPTRRRSASGPARCASRGSRRDSARAAGSCRR